MVSRKAYVKAKDRLCKNPYPIISRGNTGFDIDTKDDFEKLKKLRFKYRSMIKNIINKIINFLALN